MSIVWISRAWITSTATLGYSCHDGVDINSKTLVSSRLDNIQQPTPRRPKTTSLSAVPTATGQHFLVSPSPVEKKRKKTKPNQNTRNEKENKTKNSSGTMASAISWSTNHSSPCCALIQIVGLLFYIRSLCLEAKSTLRGPCGSYLSLKYAHPSGVAAQVDDAKPWEVVILQAIQSLNLVTLPQKEQKKQQNNNNAKKRCAILA